MIDRNTYGLAELCEVEITIEKSKRYKLPGADEISTKLIQIKVKYYILRPLSH
jgi:hypothetical protein